jgi:hypothetical protein
MRRMFMEGLGTLSPLILLTYWLLLHMVRVFPVTFKVTSKLAMHHPLWYHVPRIYPSHALFGIIRLLHVRVIITIQDF